MDEHFPPLLLKNLMALRNISARGAFLDHGFGRNLDLSILLNGKLINHPPPLEQVHQQSVSNGALFVGGKFQEISNRTH